MTTLIQDLVKLGGSFRGKHEKDRCEIVNNNSSNCLPSHETNNTFFYIAAGKYDRKPYKEKLTDNLLSFCSNRGGTYLVSRKNSEPVYMILLTWD